MKTPRLLFQVAAFFFLLTAPSAAQAPSPQWPSTQAPALQLPAPAQGAPPQWGTQQAQASPPSYFKADRSFVLRTIGEHSTNYIFSDLLTSQRRNFVARTLERLPAPGCPDSPSFTITHVNPEHKDATTLAWTERYELDCDPKIRRNMLIIAGKERSSSHEIFPGDTITGVQLQKDAMMTAGVMAMSKKPSGCQEQALLVDTQLVAGAKPPTEWNEVWTFKLCGTKVDVDMKFGAAPQGGTAFSAHAR